MENTYMCYWISLLYTIINIIHQLSHGRKSPVGCSPWGCQESDTTERLHFHFSLSCLGEGNGNPLRYSCLENPRDGGAWLASIYGIAQSRTLMKWLSSSSSSRYSQNPALVNAEKEFKKSLQINASPLLIVSQLSSCVTFLYDLFSLWYFLQLFKCAGRIL